MNLYGAFILGVNIKYRLFCTPLPPYGGDTGERVNMHYILCIANCNGHQRYRQRNMYNVSMQ